MMYESAVCDRIEDGVCVFLTDAGQIFHLPVPLADSLLGGDQNAKTGEHIQEGMRVLCTFGEDGAVVSLAIDRAETEKRRAKMRSMLDGLFAGGGKDEP